jgi:hypothetical protein
MNILFDWVNRWAGKFTYRILAILGASKESRDKFINAWNERKQEVIDADRELSRKVIKANWIIYGLIFCAGILTYRYLKNRK